MNKVVKLIAATLAATLLSATPAFAAKYNFKLAHVITAGTPIDVAANRFAELVKQRTNGEVEIKVFPSAQLGAERAIIEGVQLGTIEMSFTTTGAIAGFAPEFQVLDLPFLFPSAEAAYTFLDGDQGKKLLALLDRKGIHGVAYLENGWRNFTSSRKELKRPEDMEGQKIRVMESPMYMGLVKSLKGSPTPMAYSELPNALLQKVIDGQENPSVNIYSAKMFESQPYMIQDRHTYNVFIFKVNGKIWKGLPDNLKTIIADTAWEVKDFQRKLNREADDDFVKKLQAKGMKVHTPSADELKAWEAATKPVYETAKSAIGAQGAQWVNEATTFRKDWDAGKYKAQEAKYKADYAKIAVPVEEVMKNFK